MTKKSDADDILAFIDELATKISNNEKRFWPEHIFHFTDINNAVNILIDDNLYSRNIAIERGLMLNENANKEVIEQTGVNKSNYVRFFFRPKTPTQYHNEGIRTPTEMELDAHCPIPIFFLFSSKDLLTKEGVEYSNGGLAWDHWSEFEIGRSAQFLRSLPFDLIYNNTSLYGLSPRRKGEILFHRQAEVLIEDSIDLSFLKLIVCRSHAEKQYLINQLPESIYEKWRGKITSTPKFKMFQELWSFVEEVTIGPAQFNDEWYNFANIKFNPNSRVRGTFDLKVEIRELNDNEIIHKRLKDFDGRGKKRASFPIEWIDYEIKIYLNDILAYCNEFHELDHYVE